MKKKMKVIKQKIIKVINHVWLLVTHPICYMEGFIDGFRKSFVKSFKESYHSAMNNQLRR